MVVEALGKCPKRNQQEAYVHCYYLDSTQHHFSLLWTNGRIIVSTFFSFFFFYYVMLITIHYIISF